MKRPTLSPALPCGVWWCRYQLEEIEFQKASRRYNELFRLQQEGALTYEAAVRHTLTSHSLGQTDRPHPFVATCLPNLLPLLVARFSVFCATNSPPSPLLPFSHVQQQRVLGPQPSPAVAALIAPAPIQPTPTPQAAAPTAPAQATTPGAPPTQPQAPVPQAAAPSDPSIKPEPIKPEAPSPRPINPAITPMLPLASSSAPQAAPAQPAVPQPVPRLVPPKQPSAPRARVRPEELKDVAKWLINNHKAPADFPTTRLVQTHVRTTITHRGMGERPTHLITQ